MTRGELKAHLYAVKKEVKRVADCRTMVCDMVKHFAGLTAGADNIFTRLHRQHIEQGCI